jgi:hypothetical protein
MEAGMGKLWPFASKKHIKKQIDPVSGRVSELEEISRQHGTQIKEIDERTQAALRATMSQVEAADGKAIAAGQKANEAGVAADKAFASVGERNDAWVAGWRMSRTIASSVPSRSVSNQTRPKTRCPRQLTPWPLRSMAQKGIFEGSVLLIHEVHRGEPELSRQRAEL